MQAMSRGTTTVLLHTSNGYVQIDNVVVIDNLAYEMIIGVPTMTRMRM